MKFVLVVLLLVATAAAAVQARNVVSDIERLEADIKALSRKDASAPEAVATPDDDAEEKEKRININLSGQNNDDAQTGEDEAFVATEAGAKNPKYSYYYTKICGHGHRYVEDSGCVKAFPTNTDRNWECPIGKVDATKLSGYSPERRLSEVTVDKTALSKIPEANDPQLNIAAILIKRTSTGLHLKYVGNARAADPVETWSSSKIFTMSAAASALRQKCPNVGFVATTTSKNGPLPLGDMSTVICSYEESKGYTSNSLSKYFSYVAGRKYLNSLVHDWLSRPQETMVGSYGLEAPSDLGFTFTAVSGSGTCNKPKDTAPVNWGNTISTLTAAEWLRRMVLHREAAEAFRVPHVTWPDVQEMLYGATTPKIFPSQTAGLATGGLTVDTAIFVQSMLNMDQIESRSGGKWRIFSKLGAGYSTARSKGEVLDNAYACFPDANGGGVEFVISARASVAGDTGLNRAESVIQKGMGAVAKAIVDGVIN